jgi:hypothetical protein
LEVRWKGPFKVKKKMNYVNYMTKLDEARKKEEVYHVNLLKKFNKENEKENHKDPQKRSLMISTSEHDEESAPLGTIDPAETLINAIERVSA